MVVEEPGEEPKLYRQDTGELVTDMNVDPFLIGENNEHPNNLPKGKENAKSTTAKMYKDIDELIEKLKNDDKSERSNATSTNPANYNNKSSPVQTINNNLNNNNNDNCKTEKNHNINSRLLKDDPDAPPTPNIHRKTMQNESFKPVLNEKDTNEKLKNNQNLINNTNSNSNNKNGEKVLNRTKVINNDQPNNVPNPSPVSFGQMNANNVRNTKSTIETSTTINDTFISAKKLIDDFKTKKHANRQSLTDAIINSSINEAAKLITANTSRKSETIAISRALANNNAKITKEFFVSKSRPRSSSTKVKKSQDTNVNNDSKAANRNSPEKPIKKVTIHSNIKSTPTNTTQSQSNNMNKEIKTHLQQQNEPNTLKSPPSSLSHSIAASLPAIPPLSAKSYVPNSTTPPSTKIHHHRHHHTTILTSKENQQIINNKEKKSDLSLVNKEMRNKLPQTKQQQQENFSSGKTITTNSLKEEFLKYSGGGTGPRVSFQPNTQFTPRQSNNPTNQTTIKRHSSLYLKDYLPRSESILKYDSTRSEIDASSLSMFEKSSLLKPPASLSVIDSSKCSKLATTPISSPSPQPITDPIMTHIKMKPKSTIQLREKKGAKIDAAKHRFTQVYERYSHYAPSSHIQQHHQSNSDCSTIGELKSMTKSATVKKVF